MTSPCAASVRRAVVSVLVVACPSARADATAAAESDFKVAMTPSPCAIHDRWLRSFISAASDFSRALFNGKHLAPLSVTSQA